jgi:hypothetical protein
MGNQPSNIQMDNEKLLKRNIDAIAAKYILTQNFKDMIDLNNPEVCNNLVIITSQIIKKSLNWRTILYLDQHLQGKEVVDKMAKDSVLYMDKNDMDSLDVKNNIKKRRMCIGISKFYIKINILFSAIATTLRPII